MGLSISVAAAIIGIGIIISLELILGSFLPMNSNYIDSFDQMKDRALDQIHTNFSINNIATPANASNYDLNITLENKGNIVLKTSEFNILINGTVKDFSCKTSKLYSENEIFIDIFDLEGEGNRRLKIITGNGISQYVEYTISWGVKKYGI